MRFDLKITLSTFVNRPRPCSSRRLSSGSSSAEPSTVCLSLSEINTKELQLQWDSSHLSLFRPVIPLPETVYARSLLPNVYVARGKRPNDLLFFLLVVDAPALHLIGSIVHQTDSAMLYSTVTVLVCTQHAQEKLQTSIADG